MNIALIGYGKLGKEIERISSEHNISVKKILTSTNNVKGSGLTKQALKNIDVCLDVSTPNAVLDNVAACAKAKTNIVIGTTGWYDKLPKVKQIVKASGIGVLYSSNFSIGMNIVYQILKSALEHIDKFDLYDIAIDETHHSRKKDSPSGTALTLGEIILHHSRSKKKIVHNTPRGKIKPGELRITSTREGTVVGNHCVLFDSKADTIELLHSAKNRSGFALGALLAAEWLKGKKGLFTMNDVITL